MIRLSRGKRAAQLWEKRTSGVHCGDRRQRSARTYSKDPHVYALACICLVLFCVQMRSLAGKLAIAKLPLQSVPCPSRGRRNGRLTTAYNWMAKIELRVPKLRRSAAWRTAFVRTRAEVAKIMRSAEPCEASPELKSLRDPAAKRSAREATVVVSLALLLSC